MKRLKFDHALQYTGVGRHQHKYRVVKLINTCLEFRIKSRQEISKIKNFAKLYT